MQGLRCFKPKWIFRAFILQHKIEEVYDEIHRSNMSKLDEKGEPIFREDGKIMKSTLYFKPEIRRILGIE